ncbi:unnamed protein product [Trifolium pratense]|uniref:Uncharacterized protein n=1 Tax=Trifolium pratense TaxID=57577 RepID=A0ACB0LAY6_TRIPR|nr:unnamed protein product [Trifolium pratense]
MVKEDLIHLWMANGFISSRGNLEVEHVGNDVWNELYQRSFFEEIKAHGKGNVTFKMHDIFHDIASSIMGEQCLALETASLTHLSKRVHHIKCLNVDVHFKNNLILFKRVESLRTVLNVYPPKSNLSVFPSITPLRVLSSNCTQLSALKNFIHLRLISLPKQLTQLQDLRHLMIRWCRALRATPFNIGGLTHLRTLSTFIVGSKARFGLAELHNLQLGGKLHIKCLENVSNERDAREANLIGKKELSHLYLSWGGDANSQGSGTGAEKVLEALEPRKGLKYFGMEGYKGVKIPNWMRNTSILEGLVDVILYKCINCDQLPALGVTKKAFPSLKKMTLLDFPNLERVLKAEGVEMLSQLSDLTIRGISNLAFPALPSVDTFYASCKIEDSNNDGASFLRGIAGSMHNLKKLYIENFYKLKVLPNELNSLSSLQEP